VELVGQVQRCVGRIQVACPSSPTSAASPGGSHAFGSFKVPHGSGGGSHKAGSTSPSNGWMSSLFAMAQCLPKLNLWPKPEAQFCLGMTYGECLNLHQMWENTFNSPLGRLGLWRRSFRRRMPPRRRRPGAELKKVRQARRRRLSMALSALPSAGLLLKTFHSPSLGRRSDRRTEPSRTSDRSQPGVTMWSSKAKGE
jgi:hypothetical protein